MGILVATRKLTRVIGLLLVSSLFTLIDTALRPVRGAEKIRIHDLQSIRQVYD